MALLLFLDEYSFTYAFVESRIHRATESRGTHRVFLKFEAQRRQSPVYYFPEIQSFIETQVTNKQFMWKMYWNC